jgi:ribonuclease HII
MICGIDEAGRGPVIGPLVIAGVLVDNDLKLRELGVKDSKLHTKKEREFLFKKILGIVKDYKIISLTPDIIDEALKSATSNLNILEARTTTEILNHLKPETAYIDLPDRNLARYSGYITAGLSCKVKLVCEHKADFTYPVVSAASILAKVTRDRYLDFLREKFGEDFGSGYPGDEKTIRFLEKHWNNSNINFFRKEWMSWKTMKQNKEQKRLFDY